jgi:amino acid transporter
MSPPSPEAPGRPPAYTLQRNCLTFVENVAQTAGAMAPSGGLAVIVPLVFANAGNGTWLLYVPTLAAYFFLTVNLNAFATRSASAGGLAAYAEAGLGNWAGILASWSYLAALIFAVASAAPSAAFYAGLVLSRATGIGPSLHVSSILVALFVGLAWMAAHRDIRLSTDLMLAIECLSVGAMLVLAGAYLVHTGRWIDRSQLTLTGVTPRGMRLGLILALMSLTGFETVTTLGEESRHALKNIPRAIATCIGPVGLLYLFMAYVLASAFHGSLVSLDQSDAPFDRLAAEAGWPRFSTVISIGASLSFFACLLGCLNAGARVLYSMALRGRAWRAMGRVHPRNATPSLAVACIALLALVIPLALLARGVGLGDCVGYISQLASIGFIVSYFWICMAAPFYLRRLGGLTAGPMTAAACSLGILGYALVSSVYPPPPSPWDVLPYVFAGTVAAGTGVSLLMRPRRTETGSGMRVAGSDRADAPRLP